MADIFCNNCGLIFDSRIVPCPRCQRCSRCGATCPAGADRCPAFDHALDEEALAELERGLDPSSPANQKIIRWCQRAWADSQLFGRLSIWCHLLFALLTTVCTMALAAVVAAAGINLRVREILGALVLIVCLRVFCACSGGTGRAAFFAPTHRGHAKETE
jgi:hypothetical protein